MSTGALALVLAGALCHALWNIVAKKAAGGLEFVWLFGVVSVVAAAPLALWAWTVHAQTFTPAMWFAALASGVIHVLYSLVLQRGYKVGDFAVVYPIARGTGPIRLLKYSAGRRNTLPGRFNFSPSPFAL
jgi:drug/metabolite transporter (DMT)-like permease